MSDDAIVSEQTDDSITLPARLIKYQAMNMCELATIEMFCVGCRKMPRLKCVGHKKVGPLEAWTNTRKMVFLHEFLPFIHHTFLMLNYCPLKSMG
jgi:hypothetical protein